MRAHRSHSQLSNYLHCGHQYYLAKVRRYPEVPSVWTAGGRAFHSATENFDEQGYTPEHLAKAASDGLEAWADLFTDEFEKQLEELRSIEPDEKKWRRAGRPTKDKPNKEDVMWWHAAGREFVANYITWRDAHSDVWDIALHPETGKLAIEVEVTSPLGDVPMKGYIDRMFRSKNDGRLVVVDLKSGSRTPASPMQLATYSVQAEEIFAEPILWGAWYDARKGALSEPIDLTRWSKQLLGHVYSSLDRGIEAEVFLPRIDTHCVSCGMRDLCVYQGGREPLAISAH